MQDLSGSWCIKETNRSTLVMDSPVSLMHHDSDRPWQARREGGCDGRARTPPQTAEAHFFVKKINSKKKIIVLFCLFCSNSLIA